MYRIYHYARGADANAVASDPEALVAEADGLEDAEDTVKEFLARIYSEEQVPDLTDLQWEGPKGCVCAYHTHAAEHPDGPGCGGYFIVEDPHRVWLPGLSR